jgi:hypothetical protein
MNVFYLFNKEYLKPVISKEKTLNFDSVSSIGSILFECHTAIALPQHGFYFFCMGRIVYFKNCLNLYGKHVAL